jgi:hypothetical protein
MRHLTVLRLKQILLKSNKNLKKSLVLKLVELVVEVVL